MFSKKTKFIKDFGTTEIEKLVTIYRFLWIPIFKITKEKVKQI